MDAAACVTKRSNDCWVIVKAALAEAAVSAADGTLRDSTPVLHPVMRRLIRKQRLEELQQALAHDFQDDD
jgi:hypothetical protein